MSDVEARVEARRAAEAARAEELPKGRTGIPALDERDEDRAMRYGQPGGDDQTMHAPPMDETRVEGLDVIRQNFHGMAPRHFDDEPLADNVELHDAADTSPDKVGRRPAPSEVDAQKLEDAAHPERDLPGGDRPAKR